MLVAFAVLAHGVVEPWSEAVLEAGAGILLLIWVMNAFRNADFQLVWNPLMGPLAALWVVVAIQWIAGISAVPFLTRMELLKYSALLAMFFLCVQSFRTRAHWHGFVWFLLILGFTVSLFGILQHFTFNGKLYWVRELRYGGIPFGPFVNRNHFAGFTELVIPTGMAILDSEGGTPRPVALGDAVYIAAHRGVVPCCLSRRNYQFPGGNGSTCRPRYLSPKRKKRVAGGSHRCDARGDNGFVAGHWQCSGTLCQL